MHDDKVDELAKWIAGRESGLCGSTVAYGVAKEIIDHVITTFVNDEEWLAVVLWREGQTFAVKALDPLIYDQSLTNRPTTHIGEDD